MLLVFSLIIGRTSGNFHLFRGEYLFHDFRGDGFAPFRYCETLCVLPARIDFHDYCPCLDPASTGDQAGQHSGSRGYDLRSRNCPDRFTSCYELTDAPGGMKTP